MHELSIAMNIVELVEEEAARRSVHVSAVHVRVGPLSGVVTSALIPAFEMATAGSSLEGARLVVEEVPVIVFCPVCNQRRPTESPQYLCCPECGTPVPEVVQGTELEVTALEVEDE